MFQDMGELTPDLLESFRAQSFATLHRMLGRGEYVGWLASLENEPGQIVAGAGVQLREVPPHPQTNPNGKIDIVSGRQAIIQNVFTEPKWRRRGLAALLIERIIDWTRKNGIDSVVLHASDEGALFTNDSVSSPRPRCDLTTSANRQSGPVAAATRTRPVASSELVGRIKRLRRWHKVTWPFIKDAAARARSVNIVVV